MSFVVTAVPGQRLEGDWVDFPVPTNVELHSTAYLQGAFGFLPYLSRRRPGLRMGKAAGSYDHSSFMVGPRGRVDVGPFACLNACHLICESHIEIGAHALLGWGSVVTDCWRPAQVPASARRAALRAAAEREDRWLAPLGEPQPVVLEENVWVGFEAVILPGVRLGRGCVVGSRSVVDRDVPPYAVATGAPFRIARMLDPDDTPAARREALELCA